jgi:hypothetical protein
MMKITLSIVFHGHDKQARSKHFSKLSHRILPVPVTHGQLFFVVIPLIHGKILRQGLFLEVRTRKTIEWKITIDLTEGRK